MNIKTTSFAFLFLVATVLPASAQPADPPPPPPDAGTPAEPPPPPPPDVQRFDEPTPEPPPPHKPGPKAKVEEPSSTTEPVRTMDEIAVPVARPRVTLNVFGNLSLEQSDSDHYLDFRLGGLGLLLTGKATPELALLSEAVIETDDTGATIVDLERLFLRWTNQRFEVGGGRTHTELGYWNSAFHHGKWLQLTVERPRTIRFEDDGGLLPIHSVGVWVSARTPVGTGSARATVMVANGRGKIVDDITSAGDNNLAKAVIVRAGLQDVGVKGLNVGISGSYDRIAPQPAAIRESLPDTRIHEGIVNLYLAHRGVEWTAFVEGYDVIHRAAGKTYSTYEGFALVGYKIHRYVPFVMIEGRTSKGGVDPFFVPTAMDPPVFKYVEGTAGVRYELNTWSSLKAELQIMRSGGETSELGILDWAIGL